MKAETGTTEPRQMCGACGATFSKRITLDAHISEEHEAKIRDLSKATCMDCEVPMKQTKRGGHIIVRCPCCGFSEVVI